MFLSWMMRPNRIETTPYLHDPPRMISELTCLIMHHSGAALHAPSLDLIEADEIDSMIDSTVFIARGTIVLGNVHLGKDVSLWYNTVVRGDTERIEIGDATNIQDLSMVHADPGFPCLVGPRVTVGHRVILHGCIVEEECMIGMGAILLNGVRVGKGSVVGAGAVLVEGMEVPPGSMVLGVPGRVVRAVDDALRGRIDHAWRHYVDESSRHRAGEFPIHPPGMPG
jgi:carbonic anhydrase/acetyltransferase-like protein (isoleucine patch superfamily)